MMPAQGFCHDCCRSDLGMRLAKLGNWIRKKK
jgi:hypothetical protein